VANATAITINELTANGSIVAPTAQVMDTGSAAVTVETAALSDMDRVVIEVTNTAANNLTVTIEQGENPPAFRKALGDVVSATMAQNVRRIFGPFEAARFAQADGKLQVTFTPATGTIACNFIAYRLPKV
jgi:hypothetical protein